MGFQCSLAAGQPPNAFPQDRMQVQFRDALNLDPAMAALLEGLLEPQIEDRISAAEALGLLTGDMSALPSRSASYLHFSQENFQLFENTTYWKFTGLIA